MKDKSVRDSEQLSEVKKKVSYVQSMIEKSKQITQNYKSQNY